MKPPQSPNRLLAVLVLLVTALTAPRALAQNSAGAPPEKPFVLTQAEVGENACGPCALINSLSRGDDQLKRLLERLPGKTSHDKLRQLIKDYGSKPSEEYKGKKPRYQEASGITWVDMRHFVSDLFADRDLGPIQGSYLDRDKKEPLADHLQRVHRLLARSLAAGFPPVLSIRSFYAKDQGKEFRWEGLHGHWVTLVEIPKELAENEKGFRFGYADSVTGKVEYGYVYYDEARSFAAAKGNAEKWEWLHDRPFLCITAPSLRLLTQTAPWSARTVIILNYAIYREPE
jgi:hypothetical protein